MLSRRFGFMIPALIALAFSGINAVAQTTTVTQTFTFAVMGLASSETAQVNVVNQSGSTSSQAAPSCTGTVSFLNSSGADIGSATAFNNLSSGHFFSATLPFSAFGVSSSSRPVFRAVVSLVQTLGSGLLPCSLAVSLETYDTVSGVTHVVLPTAQQVTPALLGPVGPLVPIGPGLR